MKGTTAICLALLVGCAVAAFSEEEGEIFYVKASKSSRDPGTGNLRCNGVKADYRLFDSEVYFHAFVNPNDREPGTYVEDVWVGPVKAGCSATRYPRNINNAINSNSYTIVVDYKTCGFISSATNEIIRFRNTVSATLRFPSPPGQPNVIRRRTYKIPVECIGAANTDLTSTPVQYFDHVEPLPGAIGNFDVTLGALSRQYIRPVFGLQKNVNTYSLELSLDAEYLNDFRFIASRCWITPTANPQDSTFYEFLKPRGCPVQLNGVPRDSLVIVEQRGPGTVVFDVADVILDTAEDAPAYYFHCNVNICQKGLEQRCQQQCTSFGRFGAREAGSDQRMTSGSEIRRNRDTKIRIDANGQPYMVDV